MKSNQSKFLEERTVKLTENGTRKNPIFSSTDLKINEQGSTKHAVSSKSMKALLIYDMEMSKSDIARARAFLDVLLGALDWS